MKATLFMKPAFLPRAFLIAATVALSGCAINSGSVADSPLYAPPAGTVVTLNKDLEIQKERSRVRFDVVKSWKGSLRLSNERLPGLARPKTVTRAA